MTKPLRKGCALSSTPRSDLTQHGWRQPGESTEGIALLCCFWIVGLDGQQNEGVRDPVGPVSNIQLRWA